MIAHRPSRILRETREGKLSTVFKINLSDPRVIEIVAAAGVSGLWLCNEHVPNDWLNLEHQIRAAALYDTDVLVRVAKGSYSDYIKPLEAGAAGIMVPHVSTADEARQIVKWTRFYPLGERPLDGGNVDGAFAQAPMGEYIRFANHDRFIMLQIESPAAVANVEEIAAVPGYDFLLFGPGDYAHLIGRPGEIQAPEVQEARRRVEIAAKRHGKSCMAVGVTGTAGELIERGYGIVNAGADVISLDLAIKAALQAYPDIADDAPREESLYQPRARTASLAVSP